MMMRGKTGYEWSVDSFVFYGFVLLCVFEAEKDTRKALKIEDKKHTNG